MLDEAWGVCYYNTRFVGQAVKTPPSHGGNTGSIPVRTAKYLKPVHSWKHDVPAFFVVYIHMRYYTSMV